jgi:hypothetical protein
LTEAGGEIYQGHKLAIGLFCGLRDVFMPLPGGRDGPAHFSESEDPEQHRNDPAREAKKSRGSEPYLVRKVDDRYACDEQGCT